MQLKDIKRDIVENKMDRVYLVHGRESYMIDEIVKMLKESLNPGMLDFNLKVIEGESAGFSDIVESVETLPFMDEKRITIVRELPLLKSGKNSWSEDDEARLLKYIENIPTTSVLAFVSQEGIDKRKKPVKHIIKFGSEVCCDKLRGSELIGWVKGRFESSGLSISNSDIIYFLKICDYESKNSPKTLRDVENDIMKISSYLSGGKEVTRAAMDKLSAASLENDIFRLVDCIGTRKGAQAVKILDDMLLQGTSGIMVLSMIGKQFRIMFQAKELKDLGYSQSAIAQKVDAHQFVVKKALAEGLKFTPGQIKDILNECSNIDQLIKTGLIQEKIGIEVLISQLCSKK
ncbi:DNA polymerase III, delta subunit [Peptoclostridium litorale DSM 5388]|uniref:DNA polymerase III subunit delta n=1 Tax=Peptoclostridium litorale DSM 5388 TaxID=1121324 RepID=A0A069RLH4_PEPLI|nr:DNA polymerase III subunit delta [Peptoclostridium litorale]KDR95052.1 DNA polymerase III, delta subunit HolA [Peptoclostridium litorale DSM 5388]SIN75806.1 DNA polymerase III, delta subunit [Peptoclostridium litorale DSM 5388]